VKPWEWSQRVTESGVTVRECWTYADRWVEWSETPSLFGPMFAAVCADMGECGPIPRARCKGTREECEAAVARWIKGRT
jgi:hypothetical protein